MSRFRILGILAISAFALVIAGCLKADQTTDAYYDKATDTLHLLIIEQNIVPEDDADKAYAAALWHNRSDFFWNSIGFSSSTALLRSGNHQCLNVDLSKISPNPLVPTAVDCNLNLITVKPGVFFTGDTKNSLCYYQQVDIPGAAIDGLLATFQKQALSALSTWAGDEIKRRTDGGVLTTWDDFLATLADDSRQPDNLTDAQKADNKLKADPAHCLSDATLDMLAKPPADVKIGFARQADQVTFTLPMSPEDQQGAIKALAIIKKKFHFPFDVAAGPGKTLSLTTNLVALINAAANPLATGNDNQPATHPADSAPPIGPDWIRAFGAKLDPTVTLQNIHDQFTKGTLPVDQAPTSDKTRAELFKPAQ